MRETIWNGKLKIENVGRRGRKNIRHKLYGITKSANQNNFNELNAVPCSAVPTAAAMKKLF